MSSLLKVSSPLILDGGFGLPRASVGKESACNVGDLDSVPGLGRSPGEGKGYALQYSGLENSMDCIVHRVTKICDPQVGRGQHCQTIARITLLLE